MSQQFTLEPTSARGDLILVAGNADGLVVAAFPGPTGGEDHIWPG